MSSTSAPFGLRKSYVIDSWPLVEMAKGRLPLQMAALLDASGRDETILLLSEMNLGEIFYLTAKEHSFERAEAMLQEIRKLPCHIVPLSDGDALGDALKAARLKVKARHTISYADAFVAALAIEPSAPVVTGDLDFLKLRDQGILEVEWLTR